ncbi:C6 zinc finger protein [Bisporella sp. PMI_857]|nr:C6 zinc finger protein [Bisporella sp. PMI_857]
MSDSSVDPSSLKPQRILACVVCQRRKVKCDRNAPCSNCVKTNAVCTPTVPAPARRRRRPNVELQARLARCEKLLEEYSTTKVGQQSPATDTDTPSATQFQEYEKPHLNWEPAGKLVNKDGAVRFTNNFLWASVYEELRAMREIMETDGSHSKGSEWHPRETTPDYSEELLLGGDSPASNLEELQPAPSQIFRLWQVYLDRVNPLTKIIHVPTLQPYLVDATSGSHVVPKNVEALLFAIYAMAVVALTEEECLDILGYSGKKAFRRFSVGARMSLIGVGFLKSHDLTTLQALLLHLISLQGRYNSYAAWIMNGACIRIAQKMGLHRDGELLGLSPFETEMRRRTWWQIVMLDAKYAMMSGLTNSLLPRPCDCKMPKNLNDADIYPSATEWFQDRNGPTEMILCLVSSKIGEFILQRSGLDGIVWRSEMGAFGPSPPSKDQLTEFKELAQDLENSLNNIMEKFCDPSAGPTHELAMQMKFLISNRMREMVRPPHEQPEWGNEITTPKDNLFKAAVCEIEQLVSQYPTTKKKGFLWFVQSFFQYNIFIYMVGQLRHRTSGSLVERAWEQIPLVYLYHRELLDISQESNVTLAAFVLRAWEARQEVLSARCGHQPDVPGYIKSLQDLMRPEDSVATVVTDQSFQSVAPTVESQGDGIDSSWDQCFPGYLGTSSLGWDMLTTPQHETVEEQLSAFEGFDIEPPIE